MCLWECGAAAERDVLTSWEGLAFHYPPWPVSAWHVPACRILSDRSKSSSSFILPGNSGLEGRRGTTWSEMLQGKQKQKSKTMTKQTIGVSDGNSLISFVCVNYKWGGKACLFSQILFPFPPRQIFPSSLERGTTIRLNSQHWNVDREDVFHLQVWPIDLFSCNPLFPIPFSSFMKRILKFSFHKREGALVPSWSPRLEASLTYSVSEEWTSMVKLLRYGGLSVTAASPTYPN